MQLIHVTDLHYTKNSPFQIQLIRALLEDLKKISDNGVSPALLVFSGDLVNNPDEPDIFDIFEEKFLRPVLSALGIRPQDVVLFRSTSRGTLTELSS